MSAILITFKDGTRREFPHEFRPGGSWTTSLRAEVGFVVVKDVWGKEFWFPTEDIKEATSTPEPRGW